MPYTRNFTLFDGSSAESSTYTSATVLFADADEASLSINTDTTSVASFTVEGSNEEGFDASIVSFSVISTIGQFGTSGIFTIDPGPRWVRVLRPSSESLSIARLEVKSG